MWGEAFGAKYFGDTSVVLNGHFCTSIHHTLLWEDAYFQLGRGQNPWPRLSDYGHTGELLWIRAHGSISSSKSHPRRA